MIESSQRNVVDVTDGAPKKARATPSAPKQSTGSEGRRYNRRSGPSDETPPYFEAFARIASALEGIERTLEHLALDRARDRDQNATGVGAGRRPHD